MLNGRGADVVEFNYKPADQDFVTLWREGIQAPSDAGGPVASGVGSFHDAYRGGWQEVLPNGGAPSVFEGAEYGQHGEVARLFWDATPVTDREDEVTIELRTFLTRTPLVLTKRITIDAGEPAMTVAEELTNPSAVPQRAMWGQHIVFGPPFLSERCRIELDDGARVIPHHEIDGIPERRLEVARDHRWPHASSPTGDAVDLSKIPPRGAPTEMAYVTDLREGRYAIVDERGIGLEVSWDRERFPYLWLWQELGASLSYPWYGDAYLVGLEPFSSFPTDGLPEAVRNGTAFEIAAGETIRTTWRASVLDRRLAS